jgi:hypothetical protein
MDGRLIIKLILKERCYGHLMDHIHLYHGRDQCKFLVKPGKEIYGFIKGGTFLD